MRRTILSLAARVVATGAVWLAPGVVCAQGGGPIAAGARRGALDPRTAHGTVAAALVASSVDAHPVLFPARDDRAAPVRRRAPWWAPLASAIVPGAGQLLMGQQRGAAYTAVDLYTWLQFHEQSRDARRYRERYKAIARDVARRSFGGSMADGDWDYYERLDDPAWVGSGRFDASSGGEFQPETADSTYNAYIWERARQIYWRDANTPPPKTDPSYQLALDFYRRRAYGPDYAWSWRDRQILRDQYRRTIDQFNQATRNVTQDLGVLTANRLLSTVDALVTVRLRRLGGPDRGLRLDATVPWAPLGRRGARDDR